MYERELGKFSKLLKELCNLRQSDIEEIAKTFVIKDGKLFINPKDCKLEKDLFLKAFEMSGLNKLVDKIYIKSGDEKISVFTLNAKEQEEKEKQDAISEVLRKARAIEEKESVVKDDDFEIEF